MSNSTEIDSTFDESSVKADAPKKSRRRTGPIALIRSVVAELRKVVWPSRKEVTRYSLVVLFTLVLMIAIISLLDYVFSEGAIFLFK